MADFVVMHLLAGTVLFVPPFALSEAVLRLFNHDLPKLAGAVGHVFALTLLPMLAVAT